MEHTLDEDADDFFAHHGVKGMKWGQRHDNGHEGETAKTRVIAKADKKYAKSFTGMAGFIKVHNEVAGQMNKRLDGMNAKYEKTNMNLFKPTAANKKINDAYLKDYEKVVSESVSAAMKTFGSNASGTGRVKLTKVGSGQDAWYEASWEDTSKVKHADDTSLRMKITPKLDSRGFIVSQTIEAITDDVEHGGISAAENFLAHHGIKGMKWGVKNQSRLDRQTRVAEGKGSLGDKYATLHESGLAGLIKNHGLKGNAAALAKKTAERKERIETGKASVRDALRTIGERSIIDIIKKR